MEFESIDLEQFDFDKGEKPNESTSFQSLNTKDQTNQEYLQCMPIPIYKQPKIPTKFFIIGDALITLDPKSDLQFMEIIKMQNQYRPLKCIQTYNHNRFTRIKVESSVQGIKDFRFVIKMMQSIPDQKMYALSKELENYQKIVDEDQYKTFLNDPDLLEKRKGLFQYQQEHIVEQILQEQSNDPRIQVYDFFDCTQGMIDSRQAEYGFNSDYVHLIGSDMETMKTFTMREGWFNTSQILETNALSQLYLEKYLSRLFNNGEIDQFDYFEHKILTLDQIVVPVVFKPNVYFIYDDNTFDGSLNLQKVSKVISFMIVFYIDIKMEHIQNLLNIRSQQNTINKNNLLIHTLDHTLSQFQYEIQSSFFENKFYTEPKNQYIPKKPQLNDLYPGQTCKYRLIQRPPNQQ